MHANREHDGLRLFDWQEQLVSSEDMRVTVQMSNQNSCSCRHHLRSLTRRSEQLIVPCLEGPIAFACSRLQSRFVRDFDSSATVFDDAGLLQRVGYDGYRVTLDSDQSREQLLRHGKTFSIPQIAGAQEPA